MPGYPDWQPPRPSAGALTVATLADPPVNTGFTFAVAANELWRPVVLTFAITNVVAGTQWRLAVVRAGTTIAMVPLPAAVTVAPGRVTYARGVGVAYTPNGGDFLVPLPDVTLSPGDTLVFTGPAGGDNIGPPTLAYELMTA